MAAANGVLRVRRVGLKTVDYRTQQSGSAEQGFVHTVSLGELPSGTECQAWNETNAAITAE